MHGGVMSEAARSWAEQSEYDLDTARAMLKSERYLYVLFCCQQAIEKALKAVIVGRTGKLPPRVHNLLRLASAAGVELDNHKKRFLAELSAYYIQSRYPEEIRASSSTITREIADSTLRRAEEISQWLLSTLT
jgi:HEPN domain-containing protein